LLTTGTRDLIRSFGTVVDRVECVGKVDAAVRAVLDGLATREQLPSPPNDPDSGKSPRDSPGLKSTIEECDFEKTGYLGLLIDNVRYVLRREGKENEIILTSKRLWWKILLILIGKKGRFCSRSEIGEAWIVSESDYPPQHGTMSDALSELRSRLKPLGLKIPNARHIGWKLVDIDQTTE
jgi:hypothetical protein